MKNNIGYRILMTGGHMTPAVSIIQEIRAEKLPWEVHFVGRKYAMEGDTSVSPEYQIISAMHIPFHTLHAGRLPRFFSLSAVGTISKIPIGFLEAFQILNNIKPNIIVSFGGYIALPIVFASIFKKIPVITHEQTSIMGLSNRLIARVAKEVTLNFPNTTHSSRFSSAKVIGLPFRKMLFTPPGSPTFLYPKNTPIIYITGGSTGAQVMNEKVFLVLEKLITQFVIVHQTGNRSIEKAYRMKRALPQSLQDRYIPQAFFVESDVAWLYKHARVIVGRSGANTVSEIAATGSVALFIPLPESADGEQVRNAQILENFGSANVLQQDTMTEDDFVNKIREISQNETMKKCALRLSKNIPRDGAHVFVTEIARLLSS